MKHNKITKKAIEAFVKSKLANDDKWAARALVRIYDMQTPAEKTMLETNEENNVGFNGYDANLLSSFAKQYIDRKFLSVRQMEIVKQRIPKYWKQIIAIASGHDSFIRFMNDDELFKRGR